jgi:hypothetical protein
VSRRTIEVHMPRKAHALLSSLITLKEGLRIDISAESGLIDSGVIAAYYPARRGRQRQPSAGATCFRIASITCAL